MFQRLRTFFGWYPNQPPIGEASELQRVLYEYTDLLYTNNLLGTLDYLYPKLFELIPEPQFRAMAAREMEDAVGVEIGEAGTDRVSAPFVWEGVEYRLVDYHFTLWLPVEPEDLANTEQLLRSTYRDQRVSIEDDHRLRVDFCRQLYGIYDPAYSEWKILEKKPELKKLLHEVLPVAVLRRWPF